MGLGFGVQGLGLVGRHNDFERHAYLGLYIGGLRTYILVFWKPTQKKRKKYKHKLHTSGGLSFTNNTYWGEGGLLNPQGKTSLGDVDVYKGELLRGGGGWKKTYGFLVVDQGTVPYMYPLSGIRDWGLGFRV